MTRVTCKYCGKLFSISDSRLKSGRGVYCSTECKKAGQNQTFDDNSFKVNNYQFHKLGYVIGNYEKIELGERQAQFVNKDKFDHYFFSNGINSEETAYILGVLITDGSMFEHSKGSVGFGLEMTDIDIVEKIAKTIKYKNKIYRTKSRQTAKIHITSPYLFNDLAELGCALNKTEIATYPDIDKKYDSHFIRGVIDGDGSWVVRGRRGLSLQICGNDLLLYGLYLRIKEHTGKAPQSVQYPAKWDKRIKMSSFAHVRYNTRDSIVIRDWVYESAHIYGNRKYSKAFSIPDSYTDSFNTPSLAKHLGVAEDFVKKNVKKHNLPHEKIGPYYIFNNEHVPIWEEFLRLRLKDIRCKLPNREQLREKWLQ